MLSSPDALFLNIKAVVFRIAGFSPNAAQTEEVLTAIYALRANLRDMPAPRAIDCPACTDLSALI